MLQWKVGNVTITSVAELDDGAVPGPILIPEATADAVLGIEGYDRISSMTPATSCCGSRRWSRP